MDRRTFLELSGATPLALAAADSLPKYRIVSAYPAADNPGMPGPYPGHVISVHAPRSIDPETEKVDAATVREMISRGMRELTAVKSDADAWRRFFTPSDVVGIKVNCSGAPGTMSLPEVVAEITRNLVAIGIKATVRWTRSFWSQRSGIERPATLSA